MSTDPYDDILNRAKGLSPADQKRLIDELARNAPSNGQNGGKTVGECLEARGLLDIAEKGPTDLSTNPEHMEGFGEHGD